MRKQKPVATLLERWATPDDDFLEVHRLGAPHGSAAETPHVLLLHGLEGSARSHYAQGLLGEMRKRRWSADLLIWRSCGTEPNRTRRFYHSGETADLALALHRIAAERPNAPLAVVGVSLGGNILLKYLGEQGNSARELVAVAAAISVPFDLGRGCDHINHGFSRLYQKYFLDSLRQKAIEKHTRYPDLPPPQRIASITTLRDFDDVVTAPVHGFADAVDYYNRSSSIQFLQDIVVDTLLLSALDDPFLPSDVLAQTARLAARNPRLTVDFTRGGGHAGFVGGRNPFRPTYYLEERVGDFLAERFEAADVITINP
jgi:predicted alpha/beta-fold hydrolase